MCPLTLTEISAQIEFEGASNSIAAKFMALPAKSLGKPDVIVGLPFLLQQRCIFNLSKKWRSYQRHSLR
jgi:hypothetical protein